VAPNQQAYIYFSMKRGKNHELGTGFLVHNRIISAVKWVEFVSDGMACITKRSLA
jgi:hypothetical protein